MRRLRAWLTKPREYTIYHQVKRYTNDDGFPVEEEFTLSFFVFRKTE